MALSKEWYDAEFVDSESETLHRASMIFTFSLVMVNVPGLATSPITEIL